MNMRILKLIAVTLFVQLLIDLSLCTNAFGQDPLRFKADIEKFKTASEVNSTHLAVFAGSSSFAHWTFLQESFPGKNVLNCGFGGSQTSDLIYYANEAIIRYNPETVFIYEGDNDISYGKSSEEILEDTRELIYIIHSNLPNAKIVFIAPKPSQRRWDKGLKDKYLEYNSLLKKEVRKYKYVKMVDVWNIMLDKSGVPNKSLFMDDNLHMTKPGYALWAKKLKKYMP
ncbi:GDSL-type esterase/lipase family protein [Mariniphaga sediminis]|nr:GDSL-type esterase/lipase family protein [Mariniphaga sediminis]